MTLNKAEKIAREVEALRRDDGLIVPEDVVRWAREHPDSALHSQFEWDDGKAAEAYRIWQARRVIAVCVVAEDGERKLVSLSIDRRGGGYRDVQDVIAKDELRKVLLRDALQELKRVRAKYEHIKELASVYAEIEKVDRQYVAQEHQAAA